MHKAGSSARSAGSLSWKGAASCSLTGGQGVDCDGADDNRHQLYIRSLSIAYKVSNVQYQAIYTYDNA